MGRLARRVPEVGRGRVFTMSKDTIFGAEETSASPKKKRTRQFHVALGALEPRIKAMAAHKGCSIAAMIRELLEEGIHAKEQWLLRGEGYQPSTESKPFVLSRAGTLEKDAELSTGRPGVWRQKFDAKGEPLSELEFMETKR